MKHPSVKWVVLAILSAVPSIHFAQAGSEIILFDFHLKESKISISNPRNITNHKGYDNQPSFHADMPIVYYSSFNDSGRADIKFYNFKTNETKSLTRSHEREYSPTLTPDQLYVSCIIQRDNGAQDLGKYPVEGGDPLTIIDNLVVGYHVWADNSHLALFVLGKENMPNTLHFFILPTRHDRILAENIGRSLHRIPQKNEISFIHKTDGQNWTIKKFNPASDEIAEIAKTLPGREDLCWTPDGKIVMSDGIKIFWLDPQKDTVWKEVEIKSGFEFLKGITRLAVNAEGNKLAVVVSE
ncbi:MAG: hypothetical protein JST37_10910 [Bacteroidetes bacterium]|nr:hypothetical protein [Bacteroidota bacterium]MBS1981802.1 hypothetical protein [Bacteroidota bacterium]